MTNVRLCTGKTADIPFYLNSACMNVFCVEELCYLLALNPFMINDSIVSDDLIFWLGHECGLEDLAAMLKNLTRKGCQTGEFVRMIMDYVNYCDEDEKKIISDTLKNSVGLDDWGRKKQQADFLLRANRYEVAIEEYENLLSTLSDAQNDLRGKVYDNMGYAYAKLFMFDVSSKYYKRAFDLTRDPRTAMCYLASLRMFLSDEKYIEVISRHPEFSQSSLEIENRINSVLDSYETSEEFRMLDTLKVMKEEGNVTAYYDEIDKVIEGMKEDYLKQVLD